MRHTEQVQAWIAVLERNGYVITERMGSRATLGAVARDSRDAVSAEDRDPDFWTLLDVQHTMLTWKKVRDGIHNHSEAVL